MRPPPLVVAIDGRSGAGKTTIATELAAGLGAVVINGDDFYNATMTDRDWDMRDASERARDVIDWKRMREEAIGPLRQGADAQWTTYDYERGPYPDGSYPMSRTVAVKSHPVILIDGAYSGRPELADLVDVSVLVEADDVVRRRRLASREDPAFLEQWHLRWDDAEMHYFANIRPRESFDILVQVE